MARPHYEPAGPDKLVHQAWLATMRAAIACDMSSQSSAARDLEQITLELHRVHESLVKRQGARVLPFRMPDCSSAQVRIEDLP